jgi:predicted membrane protein
MNYKKVNNLTGWILAAIAFAVYFISMERTASFWDCGEFLACAYKLEVGHSPGAPFFMLLQRMFALFSGTDAWFGRPSITAAYAINTLSVLMSALTILFLFWTITALAKKVISRNAMPDKKQVISIMCAGIVGSLAYTFSDTFWFSAVEAEVYATSSFFTAIVFWSILKWEQIADEPYADRWLVFIAFLVGISIGVHLLNLLTIPAIAMVYYFRRYKTTRVGIFIAFVTGCLILALVQFGVIQYLPIMASTLELFFVNGLGLPFNSGTFTFLLLLIGVLAWGLLFAKKKNKPSLHTGILCLIFIIIGFSSYIIPIIRSNADTPVDVNNPDNIISLVPYVQREQYIHPPLLYGQDFDSEITRVKEGKKFYYPEQNNEGHSYKQAGEKAEYIYENSDQRLFPRIWDNFEPSHQQFYRNYLGLAKEEKASAKDNLSYFFNYQINWLWFRYFMWNYAGRQNDAEGQSEARNGNWISGISFLDYSRIGHINLMSAPYKNNAARNELYCLPLILGILGMIWHIRSNKKDALVIGLFFFCTGIAIALYLNMNPVQPRERDYAFVGCTYAFAIWIGMGVLFLEKIWSRFLKNASTIVVFGLCLIAVPALMAKEGWDDHNRSGKSLAKATARNTLLSCEPNAILFTQGDNDTYPLWYLQEVEGVRPDVRVIITELLNADWYIDQLRHKVNGADAVPMVWTREDYMGDNNNYIQYYEHPQIPKDRYFDLYEICTFTASKDDRNKLSTSTGKRVRFLPSKNFSLNLPAAALADTTIIADSSNRIYFSIKENGVQKKELAIMNILAANARNGWKRPIYFNGSYPNRDDVLGLNAYMRMEGIVYKLAPFTQGDYNETNRQVNNMDVNKSVQHFTSLYQYGGAEKTNVYFDEKNRVMLMSYRLNSVQLADRLSAMNRKKEAIQLLDKMLQNITTSSYPHDDLSLYIAEAYYHAGAMQKAGAIARILADNAKQDMVWINDLSETKKNASMNDLQRDQALLERLYQTARSAGDTQTADYLNMGSKEVLPLLEHGMKAE